MMKVKISNVLVIVYALYTASMQSPRAFADGSLALSVPGAAVAHLIANDKVIDDLHCESASLQQTILDLSRKAGVKVIVEESLQNQKVSGDFSGLRISQIFDTLSKKCNIAFESISADTLLVKSVDATTSDVSPKSTNTQTESESNPSTTVLASTNINKSPAESTSVPPENNKSEIMLQGGIEHLESLPPVSLELRTGAVITEKKMRGLQAMVPDNLWCRLPNWAGGTWKTRSQTAYYFYSYKFKAKNFEIDTFMNKGSETFGHQKDREGNLWDWQRANYWTSAEGDTSYSLTFNKEAEIVSQDDKQFTIHYLGTRAIVDKITRRVRKVYQMESIQTYSNPEPDIIRCKSSIKEFDETGRPMSLQKSISYKHKIAQYAPWNFDRGEDLRNLFAQYLKTHGLQHLIAGQR